MQSWDYNPAIKFGEGKKWGRIDQQYRLSHFPVRYYSWTKSVTPLVAGPFHHPSHSTLYVTCSHDPTKARL